MSSRFVWAPPTRLVLGEGPARPRTARDLLGDLGLRSAPTEVQREGVYAWLNQNAADRLMAVSLRRKGLPVSPVESITSNAEALAVTPGTATVVSVDPGAVSAFTLPKARPLSWRVEFTFATSIDDPFRGWQASLKDASEPERYVDGELVA